MISLMQLEMENGHETSALPESLIHLPCSLVKRKGKSEFTFCHNLFFYIDSPVTVLMNIISINLEGKASPKNEL